MRACGNFHVSCHRKYGRQLLHVHVVIGGCHAHTHAHASRGMARLRVPILEKSQMRFIRFSEQVKAAYDNEPCFVALSSRRSGMAVCCGGLPSANSNLAGALVSCTQSNTQGAFFFTVLRLHMSCCLLVLKLNAPLLFCRRVKNGVNILSRRCRMIGTRSGFVFL
jgi:hypothetical protein